MKNGETTSGPIQVIRDAGIIIVMIILALNLVALILSFPSVYEEASDTYRSGLNGSLPLPFFNLSSSDVGIDLPDSISLGETFTVKVWTESGEMPDLPMGLRFLEENETRRDTPLHDSFDSEENWFSWTIVQGFLPVGTHDVLLTYRSSTTNITALDTGRSINVTEAFSPYVTVGSMDNVVDDDIFPLMIHGQGTVDRIMITSDDIGTNMINMSEGGDPLIDRLEYVLSGWERITLEIISGENSRFFEMILLFPEDNSNIDLTFDLKIDQPFNEFDRLYGQEPADHRRLVEDDIELLSSTYYRFNLYLEVPESGRYRDGIPEVPMPLPVMLMEDIMVRLRPVDISGNFSGIARTPSGYGENGMDGIRIDNWPFDEGSSFLSSDLVLKKRQSPKLRIDPDPYRMDESIPLVYNVTLTEGFELVSYREFTGDIDMMLNGDRLNTARDRKETENGVEISYRSILSPQTKNSTIGIEANTTFQMKVWISMIFLTVPIPIVGIGVPVWFTLVSMAIGISVLVLAYRSIIHRGRNGGGESRFKDPFSEGSDISVLSSTFIGALFFSYAIVFLFDILEQPTPVPDILSEETPIWIRMVLLADASVWEEVISRVMLIGLPLLLFGSSDEKGFSRLKILLGGQGIFGTGEVVLILLSSSFFGLAHLGWGPWKVIPTFVTGALFGYIYVKVGLHAAIAMHFLFDYSSFIYDLTDISYFPLYVLYIFTLFTGAFFLARILTGFKRWTESRSGRRLEPKWILIIHSSVSLILMGYLLRTDPGRPYITALALVPVLEICGYLLHRYVSSSKREAADPENSFGERSMFYLSAILVSVASLITLALAPIGLMWVFDRAPSTSGVGEDLKPGIVRRPPGNGSRRSQYRPRHS